MPASALTLCGADYAQALGDKNYVAAVQVRLVGWAPWQLRTLLAAAPPREERDGG